MKYNVLILGASYGSLLATKLLMVGHGVTLVCTGPTASLINLEGTRLRFPVKGREALLEIPSAAPPASCAQASQPKSIPAATTWSSSACRRPSTARRACAN